MRSLTHVLFVGKLFQLLNIWKSMRKYILVWKLMCVLSVEIYFLQSVSWKSTKEPILERNLIHVLIAEGISLIQVLWKDMRECILEKSRTNALYVWGVSLHQVLYWDIEKNVAKSCCHCEQRANTGAPELYDCVFPGCVTNFGRVFFFFPSVTHWIVFKLVLTMQHDLFKHPCAKHKIEIYSVKSAQNSITKPLWKSDTIDLL